MTALVYLGMSVCVGYFGRKRILGFWGFFLPSLILALFLKIGGPLLVLGILAITKDKRPVIYASARQPVR